jgi:hypothetical protein
MSICGQRNITRVVLFLALFALSLSVSWAGLTEGSPQINRNNLDVATGQVFIYDGGFFNNNEQVTTFSWLGDMFAGSRFMTPILFQETSAGVFTVVGIGTGRTVTSNGGIQSFAFGLVSGTDTTAGSGMFFFGFVNALLNSNGTQSSASMGTVDMNIPLSACCGVDGSSSNDWIFTPTTTPPTVAVGTTFFQPGVGGASGNFMLNSGTGTQQDRTYSAQLTGNATGVPEPGTFTLFTSGAGLLLAGLLRFRRTPRA